MERVSVDGGLVLVVSTVHGLAAERDAVRAAFDDAQPAIVALGVSPEALSALLRYQKSEGEDPFEDLPDAEVAYSYGLSKFGEVDLPPPDLAEAVRLAKERDVPVHGVDLTEEQYQEAFVEEVGAFSLLRYGRVQRKLANRPPKASDARAFSLAWDARIRKVRAIGRVEARREARMADVAARLARDAAGPVLLLVDAPREAGVLACLNGQGKGSSARAE